jgi:cell pole-organizing protein PopZ
MPEAATQSGSSESMEDILQSIKRIIEDDNDAETAKPADKPDVLDLTQVVSDDGSVADIAPPAPPKQAPAPSSNQDIIASIDSMVASEKSSEKSENKPAEAIPSLPEEFVQKSNPTMPAFKPKMMEDGLVSDQAAQAAAAALKPIVESAHRNEPMPHIPSPGMRNGATVEDLIMESLRPMLKAWLDEHLPTIVQKIVEKEVKRIVTFHQD